MLGCLKRDLIKKGLRHCPLYLVLSPYWRLKRDLIKKGLRRDHIAWLTS
ncbi:protein of unknown function [Methylocaldum szegediense]|uniref:Uncharacterized protein n=1 Tax=Methylocaldum szegediense TaxID=73780 RepID=A0ABM9HYJ3_9GAMM|nr:protein of unknown function [Methylocaldum szegediense]